jgi:Cu(I)/Ag(I) efflux system membrane fusion protein
MPPTDPTPSDPPPGRGTPAIVVAGLVLGAVVALLLPSDWVFVAPSDGGAGDAADTGAAQYSCPMFCVVMDHMPEDGKCPVCGMDMTVVSGESTLDRAEQRMVGLEADVARRLPLVRKLRVVGEVDYDESRLARITTRVGGWLETVWVDATFSEVEQGEPLAAIFSPELYAAEQEYLGAWKAREQGAGTHGDALLRAARRRLQLLDVDDREIEELPESGFPRDSVVLRAPIGGVVVERDAIEGASVAKGATLYAVADLARVWVQAQVFESDLPWIRVGQAVTLAVQGAAAPMEGRVAFVDPVIDRSARTARVRIEVENPRAAEGDRPLRIGQRVDAWIEARLDARGRLASGEVDADARPIAVPRTAVLRTGERSLVYVLFRERETDDGRERDYHLDPDALPDDVYYEPVQVRLGPLARLPGDYALEEFYPILGVVPPRPHMDPETGERHESMSLRRLTEGVTVVTKGNLLLDSQAQLAGKPSLLFPEGNRGASDDPHAGH